VRLDHLLSKEHVPLMVTECVATYGGAPLWNRRCNLAGFLVGVAHCWVLRDQAGSHMLVVCGGGWFLCCSVEWSSFGCWSPVGGWWWLVGLLFEIWIVDASIL
jgi:hypothetical protein